MKLSITEEPLEIRAVEFTGRHIRVAPLVPGFSVGSQMTRRQETVRETVLKSLESTMMPSGIAALMLTIRPHRNE